MKADLFRRLPELAAHPPLLGAALELVQAALADDAWQRMNSPPCILVAIDHGDHIQVVQVALDGLTPCDDPDPPHWAGRLFAFTDELPVTTHHLID